MIRILAFAGSSRTDSFNRSLISIAARGAREAGADVTLVELADYPMPLMSEDLEAAEGMPGKAAELKRMMIGSDGFLIASPEYNSSISPLLKNTIDWASRSESEDEPPLSAFSGKTAVIMSASPGKLGGLRGLVVLRMLLANLGITVLPEQRCIGSAHRAFEEDGELADKRLHVAVRDLGRLLAETVDRLKREK